MTVQTLWLHYFSVGGNLRAFELEAYLNGAYLLPVAERNLVALALNEVIDTLPQRPRAAFDDDLSPLPGRMVPPPPDGARPDSEADDS